MQSTAAPRQEDFHGKLMAEQALGKHAVKTLNDGLVSMNFSAPAVNKDFVVFHFFGYASHKLVVRINLQHLPPSERALLVNQLKGLRNFSRVFPAGDVDNCQRVFVKSAATRKLVIWQNKKVHLMDRVRRVGSQFWTENVAGM